MDKAEWTRLLVVCIGVCALAMVVRGRKKDAGKNHRSPVASYFATLPGRGSLAGSTKSEPYGLARFTTTIEPLIARRMESLDEEEPEDINALEITVSGLPGTSAPSPTCVTVYPAITPIERIVFVSMLSAYSAPPACVAEVLERDGGFGG